MDIFLRISSLMGHTKIDNLEEAINSKAYIDECLTAPKMVLGILSHKAYDSNLQNIRSGMISGVCILGSKDLQRNYDYRLLKARMLLYHHQRNTQVNKA
jgi:hypothetical protein